MKTYLRFLFVFGLMSGSAEAQINRLDFSDDLANIAFTINYDSSLYLSRQPGNYLVKLRFTGEDFKKIEFLNNSSKIILHTRNNNLLLFDAATEKVVFGFKNIYSYALGDSLLALGNASGEILLLRAKDFTIIKVLQVLSVPVTGISLKKKKSELALVGENNRIVMLDWDKNKVLCYNTEPIGTIRSIAFNEKEDVLVATVGYTMHVYDIGLKKIKIKNNAAQNANIKNYKKNLFLTDETFDGRILGSMLVVYDPKEKKMVSETSSNACSFRKGMYLDNSINKDTAHFYFYKDNPPTPDALIIKDYYPSDNPPLKEWTFPMRSISRKLIFADLSELTGTNVVHLRGFDNAWKSIKLPSEEANIQILPQFGFAAPLKSMLFSADGKYIVTVAESPVVKIWDCRTNLLIKEIKLPEFNVLRAAIHPTLPLLVIWDRNYQLHLIDLEKQVLFRTVSYTKEKYNYTGDFDDQMEFVVTMGFNKDGTLFSIDTEESTYESLKLNVATNDLINGKVNNTVMDEDLYWTMREYRDELSLFDHVLDSMKVYRYARNQYTILQADTVFYLGSTSGGNMIGFKDSTYFLDHELTKPLPVKSGLIEVDFFKESGKTYAQEKRFYILSRSESGKYTLVKSDYDGSVYIVENSTGKKVRECVSATGVFIEDVSTIFYEDGRLYNLEEGTFYDLAPGYSLLQYKHQYGGYEKELERLSHFVHVKGSHLLRFWCTKFDHSYVEYDFINHGLNFRSIPKPMLGSVRASADEPATHISYRSFFTKLDFLNMQVKDNYIDHSINGSGKEVFKLTSVPVKDSAEVTFNFYQRSFLNATTQDLNFFSVKDYFEILFRKSPGDKWKRMMHNPVKQELVPRICRVSGDGPCDWYVCEWTCEEPFNMFDSLQKIDFFKPRLSASQRLRYGTKFGDSRKYDDSGIGRTHGRGGEHAYLSHYNITFESNDINLFERYDFFDSLAIADIDVKYALRIYDAMSGQLLKQFNPPSVGSFFFHFLYQQHKVAMYAYDGSVRVYDFKGKSKDPVVTFYRDQSNYIFITPDNYYKTTSRAFNLIKFRKDGKVYGIEQFDLKYNRPDILLQRMGNTDTVLIKAYHNAYLKRLKKMGFTEGMLNGGIDLPDLKIENFELLPEVVSERAIKIDLNISDERYKLDRINVYINDVALYGLAGIDLRTQNTNSWKNTLTIELAEGLNKIQISALNQAGAESYKETVYTRYKPQESSKPDLYLITIGDSKYKDSRYDLTYAAKDAEDIARTFEQSKVYGRVHIFTLTNEKATREHILKLKAELQKAKRDDVVMITVAGHGVLDKNLDYYIATYDMDFNDPARNGVAYEELESLLDGIAPLKKLLLLDACHSGEVDKEEVEQLAMTAAGNGEIKFRAVGAGIKKKSLGLKTTGELMNELFTDLRRGTGATVISSAGGVEFAMESAEWKNGLFTYCLLHGLQDQAADLNKDGQVMLSELRQYLRTQVTDLSGGAQQPTSRLENLSMDFRVW